MINGFIILSVTFYNLTILVIGFLVFRMGFKYLQSHHDKTMNIEIHHRWFPLLKSAQFPIGLVIMLIGLGIIGFSICKEKSFIHDATYGNSLDSTIKSDKFEARYLIPKDKDTHRYLLRD